MTLSADDRDDVRAYLAVLCEGIVREAAHIIVQPLVASWASSLATLEVQLAMPPFTRDVCIEVVTDVIALLDTRIAMLIPDAVPSVRATAMATILRTLAQLCGEKEMPDAG